MKHCLTDENLELLLKRRAGWWRGFFWRRHLRSCACCRGRWQALQEDERLLAEVRRAAAAPARPSPLSTARSARRGPGG
jgi:hypothetical protein